MGRWKGQEKPVYPRERLLSRALTVEKTVSGLPGMTLGGPAFLRVGHGYQKGSIQGPDYVTLWASVCLVQCGEANSLPPQRWVLA